MTHKPRPVNTIPMFSHRWLGYTPVIALSPEIHTPAPKKTLLLSPVAHLLG